ncbi:AAA family ATPase [Thermococcus sp. 2319x1]|uniref:AAA family ATPase n=1 Tax=Thermococcus sp. 2319x1 TaxID=1674923 RepID=UPI001E415922|nr:AAA family ATPase [Thermococcus sp. 2319x1]
MSVVDVVAFKEVLEELKNKYHEEWIKRKEILLKVLEKVKTKLLEDSILKAEEAKEIKNVLMNLPPELKLFDTSVTADYSDFLNHRLFKKLIKTAADINENNFEEKINEIVKILGEIKDDDTLKGFGISKATSWMSIVNWKFFMPTWHKQKEDSPFNAPFSESLEKKINLKHFWGGQWNIEEFVEFFRVANRIRKELEIKDMIEVAYYLSKYQNRKTGESSLLEDIKQTIDKLLERKGQIILYGPPGTGKTWVAKKYVESELHSSKITIPKTPLQRKQYFILRLPPKYKDDFNNKDLDEITINANEGKKEATRAINTGDFIFIYSSWLPPRLGGRGIAAVGECVEKNAEIIKVKIQRYLQKPVTWNTLKSDEILSQIEPVKRSRFTQTLYIVTPREAQRIVELMEDQDKNIVFKHMEHERNSINGHSEFVTFHTAFSYEDFIEGIKPETYKNPDTGKEELLFKVKEGIFRRMAREAYNALLASSGINREWSSGSGLPSLTEEEKMRVKEKLNSNEFPRFYLIIDEINRGDIAKIFGELITLLEKDKRLFMENETITTLPYSKKTFGVPPNLYIIGTMNTADRSIALIDVALRRRFAFIEVMPDYNVLHETLVENASEDVKELAKLAIDALKGINSRIRKAYDRDHQIGHAYYLRLSSFINYRKAFLDELRMVWFYEIIPLLQEYFYDSPDKLKDVLNYRGWPNFIKEIDGEVEFVKPEELSDEDFLKILENLKESSE